MSLDRNSTSPGIRFNDCLFSEPVSIGTWTVPKHAGLFAILVNDPNWGPRFFQPLYFGEFGNNTPFPVLARHYPHLMAAAKGRSLYVAALPMFFSTTMQRLGLRDELIRAYNPECQTDATALPETELASRLSDLEKRYRDQTAQVTLLLASMNPSFQPLPEPSPRRRIGFMPQSEPAAG
jgi:hypothetical protein